MLSLKIILYTSYIYDAPYFENGALGFLRHSIDAILVLHQYTSTSHMKVPCHMRPPQPPPQHMRLAQHIRLSHQRGINHMRLPHIILIM